MTPLLKMHTLGHGFVPEPIHAGGLRYHGMSPLVSHVYDQGLVEAVAIPQRECFAAALRFARSEGIIPAPEPTHALAAAIREAAGVQGGRRVEGHPDRAVRPRAPRPRRLRDVPARRDGRLRAPRRRDRRGDGRRPGAGLTTAATLLIRDAEVDGRRVDVACAGGVVTHVGAAPAARTSRSTLAGGALLPGLHDHHVHLMAMAAARGSVDVGDRRPRRALRHARRVTTGCALSATTSRSAGPLDRDRLDAVVADRPVRVQHRSGQLWVLNSAALARTGIESLTEDGIERDATGGRPAGCSGATTCSASASADRRPTSAPRPAELAGRASRRSPTSRRRRTAGRPRRSSPRRAGVPASRWPSR